MTANGTEISDGASLSGSQVLRVYGSNLTPPYFSLMFNGVEYTPLDYGDGYVEYILQDNGTYEIRNENDIVMSFEVAGITIPLELPNRLEMSQSATGGSAINFVVRNSADCINYPYLYNEDYPYFRLHPGYPDKPFRDNDDSHWEGINCTLNYVLPEGQSGMYVRAALIDTEKVAYIKYKGFIITVFNYTTTPQP